MQSSDTSLDFNSFILPYIKTFNIDQDRDAKIGDFNLRTSLATFFLFPHDVGSFKLKQRIKHLDSLLRHIQYLADYPDYFSVPSTYQTPFLWLNKSEDYWDLYLLMFPYLQWVSHWGYFLSDNYVPQHHGLVQPLYERLAKDCQNPATLYDAFRASATDFIAYITRLK